MPTDNETIYLAAVVTPNGEKFCFVYDFAHRRDLLRCLGRFAEDPELSLGPGQALALAEQCQEQWGEEDD